MPQQGTGHWTASAITIFTAFFLLICGCRENPETGLSKGIAWHATIPEAIETAQAQDKPVLIQFGAEWCPYCVKMNEGTLSDSSVIEKLQSFAAVQIDVDKDSILANQYNANARRYGGMGIPSTLFLAKDGSRLKHMLGFRDPDGFISVLDSILILNAGG